MFQAKNNNIALDNDFVTSPDLQERYRLLSENNSYKSVIQKREIKQKKSTIELAIFTDRFGDKYAGFLRCSVVHHCRALYQYVEQRYPDVYEEREIKNILTNMVLVTN